MRILKFKQFFESYLESGRHLLYHTLRNPRYVKMMMDNDEIKIGIVARGPLGICFSRSSNWTNQLDNDFRIVVNSDMLIRDGYRPIPVNELSYGSGVNKTKQSKTTSNLWKGKLDWFQSSKRSTPHGVENLPKHKNSIMEVEFEERILKNIKKAGKYITYVDFVEYPTGELLESLIKYIEKYPHIKTRIMDKEKSHVVKEFLPVKSPVIDKVAI